MPPPFVGSNFAAIVIAGGPSRRLLALFRGRPVIEHTVRAALSSGAREVIVVAGRATTELKRRLQHLPVRVVTAPDEGKGDLIAAGMAALQTDPISVVLSLGDRIGVSGAHLRALADRILNPNGPRATASGYEGSVGVPAAFHSSLFVALRELSGEAGARGLLRSAGCEPELIDCPCANCIAPTAPMSTPPPRKEPRAIRRRPRRAALRAPPLTLRFAAA